MNKSPGYNSASDAGTWKFIYPLLLVVRQDGFNLGRMIS